MKKTIIILSALLIAAIAVAAIALTKKEKKPGLPLPNGVGVIDTIQAQAVYVDSLSDVLHFKQNAFIERKGLIDPGTRKFTSPPVLRLLDENKVPIPKVKAIL